MRAKEEPVAAGAPLAIMHAPRLAPTEATRRWAALLQQLFEVDPLACPTCHGVMRIVAFITQPSVIDQIVTHLRARATTATPARGAPNDPGSVGTGRHATTRSDPPRPLSTAPTP